MEFFKTKIRDIVRDEVRDMIRAEVRQMFIDMVEQIASKGLYQRPYRFGDHSASLMERFAADLSRRTLSNCKQALDRRMQQYVEGEKFVDTLVERINRKQLGGQR